MDKAEVDADVAIDAQSRANGHRSLEHHARLT
jgi:hypothetical protein